MNPPRNVLYAQSGGATGVINVTAAALLSQSRKYPEKMPKIYAASGGITGVLEEVLYDVTHVTDEELLSIGNSPGAFFGTCRYKLKSLDESEKEYDRIYEVFKAHNIGYFFYNGGNDSQDTSNKIANYCAKRNLDICCIGIPKTIDNDLVCTDTSPGFGSCAKYLAVSLAEVTADLISICTTSTKVFIMEAMGRDSGWLAGSGVVIKKNETDPPHITLVPERPLREKEFLKQVDNWVKRIGCCVVIASEGICNENGDYLQASKVTVDDFGHQQLGGVGIYLANIIKNSLGYKYQLAIPSYMQRACRHLLSETDYQMAQQVGIQAVEFALAGKRSVMASIERLGNSPFRWQITSVPLEQVANHKKILPEDFLTKDGYTLSETALEYYLPLVQGEVYPHYAEGIPSKPFFPKRSVPTLLPEFDFS